MDETEAEEIPKGSTTIRVKNRTRKRIEEAISKYVDVKLKEATKKGTLKEFVKEKNITPDDIINILIEMYL